MTTIEDFEGGNLNNYTGSHSKIEISSEITRGGSSYSLKATSWDNLYKSYFSVDGDGLANYPSPGTTLEAYVYLDGGVDDITLYGGILLGGTDPKNTYSFELTPSAAYIVRYIDGSYSGLASSSLQATDYVYRDWMRVVIDWSDSNKFTFRVEEPSGDIISEISATDTTFQQSSIGFVKNGGAPESPMYIDDVSLVGVSSPPSAPTGLTLTEL